MCFIIIFRFIHAFVDPGTTLHKPKTNTIIHHTHLPSQPYHTLVLFSIHIPLYPYQHASVFMILFTHDRNIHIICISVGILHNSLPTDVEHLWHHWSMFFMIPFTFEVQVTERMLNNFILQQWSPYEWEWILPCEGYVEDRVCVFDYFVLVLGETVIGGRGYLCVFVVVFVEELFGEVHIVVGSHHSQQLIVLNLYHKQIMQQCHICEPIITHYLVTLLCLLYLRVLPVKVINFHALCLIHCTIIGVSIMEMVLQLENEVFVIR